MTGPTITLTDAAIQHIQQMMAKQADAIGFRLSIKKTGCSGYAYLPQIITKMAAGDIHFMQNTLAIFIDPACAEWVAGTVIDYVEEQVVAGIKQKRLIYLNPNEKNRCGCGESFTIE